ncbi:hypothetical protein [Actinoplanes sp. HUAS TT8]|uniref:hypothetical protein n=1 Tax=Actinoplanes sp. HUAS TT8 TaxID=3447453 RepID=UPI003F52168D
MLLGIAVAAYLLLTLFDHGARADTGSIGQPVSHLSDSIKAATTKITKPVAPKVHTPKASTPQKINTPETKTLRVRVSKTVPHAPTTTPQPRQATSAAPKPRQIVSAAPKPRQVASATPKLRQAVPVVPKLRKTAAHVGRAEVNSLVQALPTPADARKVVVSLGLSRAILPAETQVPGLQQPVFPTVSWPSLPSLSQLTQPVAIPGTAAGELPLLPASVYPLPQVSAPRLFTVIEPPALGLSAAPAPPAFGLPGVADSPAFGLSGGTEPPAVRAQPGTPAAPVPPRQPGDRSTPAGQVRDSGGGNTPAAGTVPSSWHPEFAVAGSRPVTEFRACGRTVRYAGPPS